MVTVNELSKVYGKERKTAVDRVSFVAGKGELFGLIGPDGAGKTSIFRMLATLLLPDGGSATVAGFDIVRDYRQIRQTVGYMPGKFSLYPDLSVEENLDFFATVFRTTVAANRHLIRDIYMQLEPFRKRRAGKLSGGMKQKLALCCALIHKPTVLFLDEPTTGVDPVSRKEFWEILRKLHTQGITIIVSTPYMDEATRCDRIALIQEGRILSIDTPAAISAAYPGNLYAVRAGSMPVLLKQLRDWEYTQSCYAFGEYAHVTFDREHILTEDISGYLSARGIAHAEIKPVTATIEDCFIQLMKK